MVLFDINNTFYNKTVTVQVITISLPSDTKYQVIDYN